MSPRQCPVEIEKKKRIQQQQQQQQNNTRFVVGVFHLFRPVISGNDQRDEMHSSTYSDGKKILQEQTKQEEMKNEDEEEEEERDLK